MAMIETEQSSHTSQPLVEVHAPLKIEKQPDTLRIRRINRRLAAAASLLLTGSLGFGAAVDDISQNQELAAASTPSIYSRYEAVEPANNGRATVYMNGFGTINADMLADSIRPGMTEIYDSETWSVNYGTAPLNAGQIADRIIELADKRHVDEIALVGYSAGGDIVLDVNEQLAEKSELAVPLLGLISTPDQMANLRDDQRDQASAFLDVLSRFPLLAYSTPVRFAGEMSLEASQFTAEPADMLDIPATVAENVTAFVETAHEVNERLSSKYSPQTWLMFDQMLAIQNAHAQERIKKISEQTGRLQPTLIYLGTEAPGYDYVVDDDTSGDNICHYASEVGIDCLQYDVPGAVHTRPDLTVEAYTTTLTNARYEVQLALDRAKAAYDAAHPTFRPNLVVGK
ncbi:MAG: hypothetical protein JWN33_627 [Candidatus Saccharibacteria bacterium]|nr:hypothetical protein [Candidatus Saccharibacteria bacterium]